MGFARHLNFLCTGMTANALVFFDEGDLMTRLCQQPSRAAARNTRADNNDGLWGC
jgi:hypothetical protein